MSKISTIIVGLSGGVDSSVSAFLLKEQGYHVKAVYMKNWENDDTEVHCPFAQEIEIAEQVCSHLGIELQVVNFAEEYWTNVFDSFLTDYRNGITPNPDILCNKEIKFKVFLDYAKNRGADLIATGHYARLEKSANGYFSLLKGLDVSKDQSYFLYALNQEQLSHSIFPIGTMEKKAVRSLAKKINLPNYAKKDSTGICFIGERKFNTFLNEFLPAKPGRIESEYGEVLGQHNGLMFYTIGQRQGLNIGGYKGKLQAPWYVAKKCLQQNVLVVVQGHNHPSLFTSKLTVKNLHFINELPSSSRPLFAKTRYRQSDQACDLKLQSNALEHALVTFISPQRAITPGQSIVFYQDDICLGGGIITAEPQ